MDTDHEKKILITGGFGFVGYHLVKQLLLQGQKVIIIDNLSNSNIKHNGKRHDTYLPNNTDDNLIFYNADIRDTDSIDTIFKENPNIRTCIHLAAKINVIESIKNPEDTMDINVNGTSVILEKSAKNNVKNFVFASSAAVYGNSNNTPLKETEKCKPISPYGKSKLIAEKIVNKYSKNIKNTISLRFFNIYGIGQSKEYAGVITKFAEYLTNDDPITIFGDGNQSRDFISIKDVIRAIISVISNCDYKQRLEFTNYNNNVFNVATGNPIKIIDIAKIMIDLFNKYTSKKNLSHSPIIYQESQEGDILHSYADTNKIKEIIGFRYEDDIINGLKNYILNYKN